MLEAHAFYPMSRIGIAMHGGALAAATHLENTEENGFWPFSHLRITGLVQPQRGQSDRAWQWGYSNASAWQPTPCSDGSFLPR